VFRTGTPQRKGRPFFEAAQHVVVAHSGKSFVVAVVTIRLNPQQSQTGAVEHIPHIDVIRTGIDAVAHI
jgi:hypothetical protein